jgi:16S rRNA G527 N7-methylase RsmG
MFHVKRPGPSTTPYAHSSMRAVSREFVGRYAALLLGPRSPRELLGPTQRHQGAARLLVPALRLVASLAPPHCARVADLGAGAGAFAVVAAAAWTRTEVWAIDRSERAAAFIEASAAILELRNLRVRCVHVAPCTSPEAFEGLFQLVALRAVGDTPTSIALAFTLTDPRGSVILHHTTPEGLDPPEDLQRVRRWDLSDSLQRLYATEFARIDPDS